MSKNSLRENAIDYIRLDISFENVEAYTNDWGE